jgi:hypothetical protein
MAQYWLKWWPLVVAAVALLAIAIFSGQGMRPSTAQDVGVPREAAPSFAYVGAGTCQALEGERFVLDGRSGMSRGDRVGSAGASAITYSMSQVSARLDDLVATPHAIVVLPQAGGAEEWVACGEVGGFIDDDGLAVGLRTPRGAGLAGIAILWDDGDSSEVELYLADDALSSVDRGAEA